jgi:hypothetical protein
MRGPLREPELGETPPHRAEFGFSAVLVALSPRAGRGAPGGRFGGAAVQPALRTDLSSGRNVLWWPISLRWWMRTWRSGSGTA